MIVEKKPSSFIKIDLTGPDGNVFTLIGIAKRLAHKIGVDPKEVTNEMMSGDYEHAVTTFERYFGDYVIMER
jgi:hypothetical protein